MTMKKKEYKTPQADVMRFREDDIIAASVYDPQAEEGGGWDSGSGTNFNSEGFEL